MPETTLEEALDDCLINFDSRILVSDLLQEYDLSYEEVHKTLFNFISQQEKDGTKYEKRFLVQGIEEQSSNEIYTIVKGESKVKEWLQKLKNAESQLYAVEVAGGAKAPAQMFKPVTKCAVVLKNIKKRIIAKPYNTNPSVATAKMDTSAKPTETKTNVMAAFTKKTTEANNSVNKDKKQSSPENQESKAREVKDESKKTTPKESKFAAKKPSNNKLINDMFGAAASKSEPRKPATVVKQSPLNFFKKTEKQDTKQPAVTTVKSPKLTKSPKATKTEVKKEANVSLQLFCDEETLQSSESSDEDKDIEVLKSKIEPDEVNEKEEQSYTSAAKRRRVIDSDDEEPQTKIEKVADTGNEVEEVEEAEKNVQNKSETYLDDDGFVITVKSKNNKTAKKFSPPAKPAVKKPTKPKAPAAASTKTKQVNITNFFTKK